MALLDDTDAYHHPHAMPPRDDEGVDAAVAPEFAAIIDEYEDLASFDDAQRREIAPQLEELARAAAGVSRADRRAAARSGSA